MACCGQPRKRFVTKITKERESRSKADQRPLIEIPDDQLSERKLRIKNRQLRIKARNERIARRNARVRNRQRKSASIRYNQERKE